MSLASRDGAVETLARVGPGPYCVGAFLKRLVETVAMVTPLTKQGRELPAATAVRWHASRVLDPDEPVEELLVFTVAS